MVYSISYYDYAGFVTVDGLVIDSFGDVDYVSVDEMYRDVDYCREMDAEYNDADLANLTCKL